MPFNSSSLSIIVFLITGCQSGFGPRSLKNTHPSYNQAIAETLNEQMLLNLIRSRYRDTPYFLDVGSVTASLSLTASAGVNTQLNLGPKSNLVIPNLGFGYAQNPTLSYTLIAGRRFFKEYPLTDSTGNDSGHDSIRVEHSTGVRDLYGTHQ